MVKELVEYFKGKKILILGFGMEGQSTYKFIREYLKDQKVYIADKDELLKEENIAVYIFGECYLDNL